MIERDRGFRIEFVKAALDVPGAFLFQHGGAKYIEETL
jgi:hypothetical protein